MWHAWLWSWLSEAPSPILWAEQEKQELSRVFIRQNIVGVEDLSSSEGNTGEGG
jgi:hypothetical protein